MEVAAIACTAALMTVVGDLGCFLTVIRGVRLVQEQQRDTAKHRGMEGSGARAVRVVQRTDKGKSAMQ